MDGEKPGDLLLEVAFRPHARLRPHGRDLHLTLPVAPWEAALGAVVPVHLPGGTLNVRIPAGAEPGRQLRVRGKGIPSDPPGDVYFDIRIVAPPAVTPKAKELYEALQKEADFDPRKDWGQTEGTDADEEILEGACLTLEQLCAAAALDRDWLVRHVEEGLIPASGSPGRRMALQRGSRHPCAAHARDRAHLRGRARTGGPGGRPAGGNGRTARAPRARRGVRSAGVR